MRWALRAASGDGYSSTFETFRNIHNDDDSMLQAELCDLIDTQKRNLIDCASQNTHLNTLSH